MLKPWPPKDPNDVKDYDVNWLPELGPTDTITSSVWSIISGSGLAINSSAFTPTLAKVWLSGGVLGQTYLLNNVVTTTGGRTESEIATLRIRARPVMVVEDGTGLVNANSYATAMALNLYCSDRGLTIADGDADAALIRATQYIEANYRGRWPGARTKYRGLQSLSWPRFGAYTNDESRVNYQALQWSGYASDGFSPWSIGYLIQPNEIPIEVVQATCEAAIRELAVPGFLQPDLTLTNIKNERAGDTEFEYFQGRSMIPLVPAIDGILAPILLARTDLFGSRDRTG